MDLQDRQEWRQQFYYKDMIRSVNPFNGFDNKDAAILSGIPKYLQSQMWTFHWLYGWSKENKKKEKISRNFETSCISMDGKGDFKTQLLLF